MPNNAPKLKILQRKMCSEKRDLIAQFQPFSVYTYVLKPIEIFR